MAAPVVSSGFERFTRYNPCPVCGGYASLKPHRGIRCAGGQTDKYIYCQREQVAGDLPLNEHTTPATYTHMRNGPCGCGHEHGNAGPTPQPKKIAPAKPRKVHATIPDACPDREHSTYRKTAVYEYRAEDGTLAYVIVRYEGIGSDGRPDKTMRPFVPVSGGWECRKAEESILYRLPELLAADPWAPVFITEGEKDADRLIASGLIATTNAYGANSWGMVQDAPERLRGRNLIALEDHDEAGQSRTRDIRASTVFTARSMSIMRFEDMPEGADISDWLDAGHTIEELKRIAVALPVERTVQSAASAPVVPTEPAEAPISPWLHQRIIREIAAHRDMKASYKFALIELLTVHPNLWRGKEVLVSMPHDAEKAGMDEKTFRKALQGFHDCGVIIRRIVYKDTETKEVYTERPAHDHYRERVAVRGNLDLLASPSKIIILDELKMRQGRGPKTPCPKCGSDEVAERKVKDCMCRACGHHWEVLGKLKEPKVRTQPPAPDEDFRATGALIAEAEDAAQNVSTDGANAYPHIPDTQEDAYPSKDYPPSALKGGKAYPHMDDSEPHIQITGPCRERPCMETGCTAPQIWLVDERRMAPHTHRYEGSA